MKPQKTLRYLVILLMAGSTALSKKADDSKDAAAEERKQEELEKKREEDALIQAQFDYTYSDISDRLVVIKHELGTGSGFIAAMDGKTYLFTNQHIILGAEKISFTTVSGEKLRPRKVKLSTTRDIARLLLSDETEGFSLDVGDVRVIGVIAFGRPLEAIAVDAVEAGLDLMRR